MKFAEKKQTNTGQSTGKKGSGKQLKSVQAMSRNHTSDRQEPVQRKEKNTGLPAHLKSGIENLSGYSMNDVNVHYNSPKPGKMFAHAYAQGTDIHLASGQEKHLPHEAWHVVQQKQGRVKPGTQMKGKGDVNDDVGLEKEADVMGHKALQFAESMSAANSILQPMLPAKTSAVVQYARKDKAELLKLTVGAFDAHRKAEQMDWANAAGFTTEERDVIWNILDWGTGGLADMTLKSIFAKIKTGNNNLMLLEVYCNAINGNFGSEATIQLEKLDDITQALKEAKWLIELGGKIGHVHAKSTIPLKRFKLLIKHEFVAKAFLDYYENQNPILETSKGKEVYAFHRLVKVEKAKIADYTQHLTDIRNYHKFTKASLDKLKDDKGKKDRPLTLVLLGLHDHNGAFTRHTGVDKVIKNTKTRVYALEGRSFAQLKDLKDTGIKQIAQSNGIDGKITQVMVAGHGSSKHISVGGEATESGQINSGEYVTRPDYDKKYNLEFDEDKKVFWTDFFNAAFDNMETKNGIKAKVLLRACLTGSNEIDLKKLKEALKKTGLDLDEKGVDPTEDDNQKLIKEAIRTQYKEDGSLVSAVEDKVKIQGKEGDIDILGAQATITASATESINESTGDLGVIPVSTIHADLQDPYVAGSKIDYVRHGKEPTGALKAVIESWANDEDVFNQMTERTNNIVNTDAGFVIDLLYRTILTHYKKDILTANKLVKTAGVLAGIARGGTKCRPANLKNDKMLQKHRTDFYTAVLTKFSNEFSRLVIYHDWMQKDNSKRKEFVDKLGDAKFDKNNTKKYLNHKMLASHFQPIFTGAIGSDRGRLLLALSGFIETKQSDCKKFLLTKKDGKDKLLPELTIELKGYSEDKLRRELGLAVEAAPLIAPTGKKGAAKPQKNIDFTEEYYVVPMRPETFEANPKSKKVESKKTPAPKSKEQKPEKIEIREAPDVKSRVLESLSPDKEITVVGKVKQIDDNKEVGMYMVRRIDGTVGYVSSSSIKKKVNP